MIETMQTVGIIAVPILFFLLHDKYFQIIKHHPETVDTSVPGPFLKTVGRYLS